MEIAVVGSGDAFGAGARFQTCIALAAGARPGLEPSGVVLVDCGATSQVALWRAGVDPQAVDAVVVTHLHGDHFGGLPFLVLDGQFRRRQRDLHVVGPPGTAQRLSAAMEVLFPGSSTASRRFEIRVEEFAAPGVDGDRLPAGAFLVDAVAVRHSAGAPAYGVRVTGPDGAVLAYSGDTEWTESLIGLAAGADLFLCEGYSHRRITGHLSLQDLRAHRQRLNCRRLVLTHMSPDSLTPPDPGDGWERAHDGWHTTLIPHAADPGH